MTRHRVMPTGAIALLALATVARAQDADELPPLPGRPDAGLPLEVREALAGLDAGAAGWLTEAEAAAATETLRELAVRGLTGDGPSAVSFEPLLAGGFETTPLRPAELETAFEDSTFLVARAPEVVAELDAGVGALVSALSAWRGALGPSPEVRVKVKVTSVESHEAGFTTTALVTAVGTSHTSTVQANAVWRADWSSADGGAPRLARLVLESYEEVRSSGSFSDITTAVFGGGAFDRQLAPGLQHWRGRIDSSLGIGYLGHHGVAVGDANGDGLEDVYLCQPGGLPNRLYLRGADGRGYEAAAVAGIDYLDATHSALFCDLDGDVDQDLVIATAEEILFVENDGRAVFELVSRFATPTTTSIAAADFDADGDLDVYACGYVSPYDGSGSPLPYHDANNGKPNLLLRNEGEWRFKEVGAEVGLDTNNSRFSFAAAWEDFDDDGDLDLYVANDFGRNNLYRNDGGTFTDVAGELGVEDLSAGMGVTWGDYDLDGDLDLYVSNMFSSAGNRVAYQRRFRDGSEAALGDYRRHARGNSLFRNDGGSFTDVSEESGTTMGRWAWGARFCDLGNDGRPDIVVPNGFVTNERADDL